jgi:3'(2'), 5'-bisphosphate nucleotidase
MNYSAELTAAVRAVSEAAALTENVRATTEPDTLRKGDRSPVTIADFGSQALVCRHLERVFPGDRVIAEESADVLRQPENAPVASRILQFVREGVPNADLPSLLDWIDRGRNEEYSDRFWTLDPIDGTKGFLRGDQYAVALALVVKGVPVVAALACPKLAVPSGGENGIILFAVRGQGTREVALSDAPGGEGQAVAVSATGDPAHARFSESFESGHSSHQNAARVAEALGITRQPIRMDSQAKYAVVARGGADIYMRLPTRPGYEERIWDHAAGSLVVEEAGGRVTDVNGKPLDFSLGHTLAENTGVAASNGRLHDALLDVLAAQRIKAV